MTRDRNQHRDDVANDDGSGWLGRFLAEEDEFDRRTLWRLASWGVGSVGMLVVAILASQSPAALRRDQQAAAEIARQSQQVQWIAKESQAKARELAAAVETLNGDRDRLYARVTHLEQGLDSVTGALARPAATAPPPPASAVSASLQQAAAPPHAEAALIGPVLPPEAKVEMVQPPSLPKIASVATTAPAPSSIAAPVPPSAAKPADHQASTVPASGNANAPATMTALATPAPGTSEPGAGSEVARTEFGIDLGGANSIEGLRALWRGVVKANPEPFASLQPRILIRERNDGWGMQLRLVAGPLSDAATAAKICARLTESSRPCDTTVFEGQRLTLQSESKSRAKPIGEKKSETVTRPAKRRAKPHPEPAEDKPKTSSLGSFFSSR
jgi:hypothetical protein